MASPKTCRGNGRPRARHVTTGVIAEQTDRLADIPNAPVKVLVKEPTAVQTGGQYPAVGGKAHRAD